MSIRRIANSIRSNPGNKQIRFRKAVRAVFWQVQKRTAGGARILVLPNGLRFNLYPDCVVSSSLVYSDWPEFTELMFVRKNLRSEEIILDIGANVGHISLLLADIVGDANIFAFEPGPAAFLRLKENWQLNGFRSSQLFQVAVGASNSEVFISSSKEPETTMTVSEDPGEKTVSVKLIRLDDYRHLWANRPIGFLKIDVEGYESEVFRGCKEVLRRDRPRLIMFESLSKRLDDRISKMLRELKYRTFQLTDDGLPDFSGYSAQNLFAAPDEIATEWNCRQ